MENLFVQFSLIILVVLGVSFIMRILKQPLIIGYILSGIIIGPFFLNLVEGNEAIQAFSEMGVAFLLFIVGIHLSPTVIKEVGRISLITGLGQIIFTSLIGYLIGILLGFSHITSVYIAVALTFSSTIIIMKLLSDKEALETLYGKISIGFLLVQDLVAIIILILVSSSSDGISHENMVFFTLIKGAFLFIMLFFTSQYILPKFSSFFAKSQELLFVFAVAWGLGLASLFSYIGFSIEAGALIAGVMLSISPYSYEISSRTKPLRDFFIIFFFLFLGSQMVFLEIYNLIIPAIIFSLFILIGNPLVVIILMGLFGYSKRTGFMAGLTVAQISEFSLILVALGAKLGHISLEILSFVTLIGLVTIAGSTYMIIYSEAIYSRISKFLDIFERKKSKEKPSIDKNYDYILFGYNRIGFSIMKSLKNLRGNILVVDFNPETVKKLSSKKLTCIYGDAEDTEFLDSLKISNSRIVISTIPDLETNILIINKAKSSSKNQIVIATARKIEEAFSLYSSGADYVILPHFLGGEYTAKLIEKLKTDKKAYNTEKKKHIESLIERIEEGHEHPRIDKHLQ